MTNENCLEGIHCPACGQAARSGPDNNERNHDMTNQPNKSQPQAYRFKLSTDGCDDVLTIVFPNPKRLPIRIRYWTGNGVWKPVFRLFSTSPGLREFCEQLICEFENDLLSNHPNVRASAERELELLDGLRRAVAAAEAVR